MNENIVIPFMLEKSGLRGRIVRIDRVLDDILDRHAYPRPVAQLVAETTAAALLLSFMLKFEGIFTLQAKGDGPVSLLMADVTSSGVTRACAHFDAEKIAHLKDKSALCDILGGGYIAFTVDQGESTERYQGIVEITGRTIIDSVQNYFLKSEQIATGFRLAVQRGESGWHAGAIMLQKMPEEGGKMHTSAMADEDDWRRAMILLGSCTDAELLDNGLPPQDLLFRLFHEESVRVYDAVPVSHGCRCSREKIDHVLRSFSEQDIRDVTENGRITVTCEFCGTKYEFNQTEIVR